MSRQQRLWGMIVWNFWLFGSVYQYTSIASLSRSNACCLHAWVLNLPVQSSTLFLVPHPGLDSTDTVDRMSTQSPYSAVSGQQMEKGWARGCWHGVETSPPLPPTYPHHTQTCCSSNSQSRFGNYLLQQTNPFIFLVFATALTGRYYYFPSTDKNSVGQAS